MTDRFDPALRWVTFDCFGTLADWHGGFRTLLEPLAGARTSDLVRAYHDHERALEQECPHRSYRDVLTLGLSRAAGDCDVPLSEQQTSALVDGWDRLPVFGDVEPMLASLRASGYRLGVLTNCDDDLFERTERSFLQPFDLVVTAERVGYYKPSLAHFEHFERTTGARPGGWVHVACSWYHDIAPARALGIPRIWLDRDRTGDDPAAATAHVTDTAEVPSLVDSIFRAGLS